MPHPDYLSRLDQAKGELAVILTRYLQRSLHFGIGEPPDDFLPGITSRGKLKENHYQQAFAAKVFRKHSNNVRELVSVVLDRYSEDLFDYLYHRMSGSDELNEEGEEPFPALPSDPFARRLWLRRALAKWKAPLK